jgi:hypothetical protein
MVDPRAAAAHAADTVSAFAILGAFMGYLPAIAALGAVIWYAIQVYESKTVQGFLRERRMAAFEAKRFKHAQAIARMQARQAADLAIAKAAAVADTVNSDAATAAALTLQAATPPVEPPPTHV